MGGKTNLADRCTRCYQRRELCLCDVIPCLHTSTRLVVVMHHLEHHATTNTARLATLALTNSELRLRGLPGVPFDAGGIVTPDRTALLLYPSDDARELTPALLDSLLAPFTLVVPDGTWRQASKIGRREPALAGAIRVKLPPGPSSRYGLRRAPRAECLSTLEAIARAMGVLEGPGVQWHLENLFHTMVRRTLWSRSPDRARYAFDAAQAADDHSAQRT